MPCTTILVGKKASYDGSTMIARNDDGAFDEKKLIVVEAKDQPKKYKSKIGHLEIELPDNPLRYTSTPSVNPEHGIWAANGINEANVSMTATETITSNMRVVGADPYVVGKSKNDPWGIGEEDLVVLVLPYIKTAREGVIRLGALLEKYGTYEANGIAFADKDEIWWLETIGGHHFIARRVKDDEYVLMPNQFGIDRFDLNDAYGEQKENICSKDLKEFIKNNFLDCNNDNIFNPRKIFGSHTDQDHVYNTPRAWFMARYFNPRTYKWDGDSADFTPESDDIPWSLVPERKITVDEVKYILSSYYQGTEFNPYSKGERKGMYRSIGINRTGVMAILQIRGYMPKEIQSLEWICFGSNAFNTVLPIYTNVCSIPKYLSSTTLTVDTNTFYWSSRLIGALVDPYYGSSIQFVERYQNKTLCEGQRLVNEFDKKFIETKDLKLLVKANEEIAKMGKKETDKVLSQVLKNASIHMKNGYNRADN